MLAMDHVEAPVLAALPLKDRPTEALVFGAYKGDTIAFLRAHFSLMRVHGWEPQRWAANYCRERFRGDQNVTIDHYALGTENRMVALYEYHTDACSLLPLQNSREHGEAEMVDAREFFSPTQKFDLVVCNVEGYEFTILPYIASMCWQYVLVQEHTAHGDRQTLIDAFPSFNTLAVVGKGWLLFS